MTDTQAIIDAGHPPVAEKVALVDFDGTLFPFGQLMGEGEPLPGAAEACRALKAAGYRVVIFTSRLSQVWWYSEGMHPNVAKFEQSQYIARQCEKYGIPWDAMTAEKIPAEVYFDDKAFRVTQDEPLLAKVRDFLGAEPREYGFPPSYSRGTRWHLVSDNPGRNGFAGLKKIAACSISLYYPTGLDVRTIIERHVAPEPLCKHCARILAKEEASEQAA